MMKAAVRPRRALRGRRSGIEKLGNGSDQLRGREGYAERFVERFLRSDELALLYAAWPVGPDREAIRRAARGLWEWTRYVWSQAEQTLGEELGISLDTVAFLEAIERPYDWDLAGAPPQQMHAA